MFSLQGGGRSALWPGVGGGGGPATLSRSGIGSGVGDWASFAGGRLSCARAGSVVAYPGTPPEAFYDGDRLP